MKVYIFELCLDYGCCEIICICLSREKAEFIMEMYVEAEAKVYDAEQSHTFAESHSWNVEEMELLE